MTPRMLTNESGNFSLEINQEDNNIYLDSI